MPPEGDGAGQAWCSLEVKRRSPRSLGLDAHESRNLDTVPRDEELPFALEAGGKVTATCRGVFVAVKEGHPAFHRW